MRKIFLSAAAALILILLSSHSTAAASSIYIYARGTANGAQPSTFYFSGSINGQKILGAARITVGFDAYVFPMSTGTLFNGQIMLAGQSSCRSGQAVYVLSGAVSPSGKVELSGYLNIISSGRVVASYRLRLSGAASSNPIIIVM